MIEATASRSLRPTRRARPAVSAPPSRALIRKVITVLAQRRLIWARIKLHHAFMAASLSLPASLPMLAIWSRIAKDFRFDLLLTIHEMRLSHFQKTLREYLDRKTP